jgi:hypothetical protein
MADLRVTSQLDATHLAAGSTFPRVRLDRDVPVGVLDRGPAAARGMARGERIGQDLVPISAARRPAPDE